MAHRNAPQNVAKEGNSNQHGMATMTEESEAPSHVLPLTNAEMGTLNYFTEVRPGDDEDNTDFYRLQQKQSDGVSRRSEEAARSILSRQQRSQSVGSSNTCYVVHDAEGKPVLRLVSNGFAISRTLGGATILQESSQLSGISSRNISKNMTRHDSEEIVLMLGDSAEGSRWAKVVQLEHEAVGRKVEQSRPMQKKEIHAQRRRKKRPSRNVYSTDNQEYEGDQGSFRRHSRRERRDSKDSYDSYDDIESHPHLSRAPDSNISDYRSERGQRRPKNRNLASRSQMYHRKSEEMMQNRQSINRSAKFAGGKDSSLMTSYEETTQEPHSSVSVDFAEFAQESEEQEVVASTYEEGETEEETQETQETQETEGTEGGEAKPKAKGKGAGGGGKDKTKSPAPAGDNDNKKSVSGEGGKKSVDKGDAKNKKKSVAEGALERKKSDVGSVASKKSEAGGKSKKKSNAALTPDGGEAPEDKKSATDLADGKDKKKKKKSMSKLAAAEPSGDESTAAPTSQQQLTEDDDRGMALGQQVEDDKSIETDKKGKGKKSKAGKAASEAGSEGASDKESKPETSPKESPFKTDMEDDQDDTGKTAEMENKSDLKRAFLSAKEKEAKDKKGGKGRKGSKESVDSKKVGKKPSVDAGLVQGLQIMDSPKSSRKGSKDSLKDAAKKAERRPSKDAGLVQGLALEEQTPPGPQPAEVETRAQDNKDLFPRNIPETPGNDFTFESTPAVTTRPTERPLSPVPEDDSEALGTIVYQHVARYICIGLLRVAGGVRVLFDVSRRQAYVQVISPLCEPYVTYYVNNMTFLTSTSAAGIAWAAVVHRKKNSGSGKEDKDDGGGKPKKDKDKYSELEMASRLEKCRLPDACKSVVDTAHVVFCDPYQAQRFRTVLETLKSAAECSNCLITPCLSNVTPISFPCPPIVPCTIVDPCQRSCPPPLPPPCCSIPFCPPKQPQPLCQCMPFGTNPCFGSQMRQGPDCNCLQQTIFPLQCSDNTGQTSNKFEYNSQNMPPSSAARSPQVPPSWSQYPSPYASSLQTPNITSNNFQQPQMPYGNEMMSEPPSPYGYPPYPDQGEGRGHIRFNPNVTVFQPDPRQMGQMSQTSQSDASMRSNCCASIAASQTECFDPYSYENCFGKTLFCAPACLVRLNNEMAWTDMQKGCMKIFQCPNNGGYSLVLENSDKAITTHHFLTADTIFLPSEKTQFGFTYTTVTRSENRGNFVDHFLVSFMNCPAAEQFKCCVDNIRHILENSSEDWARAPCPSKSIKAWKGYKG